jgi:hypothetical protein
MHPNSSMRKHGLGLLILGILAFSAAAVVAQDNTSFSDPPVFTERDKILIVSGSLSNLNQQETKVVVDARATANVICRDGKGTVVRRNRKVPANARVDDTIPVEMIASGHAAFFLMSGEPVLDRRLSSCGNPKWTQKVEDVDFHSATITVTQGGKVVLRRDFKL